MVLSPDSYDFLRKLQLRRKSAGSQDHMAKILRKFLIRFSPNFRQMFLRPCFWMGKCFIFDNIHLIIFWSYFGTSRFRKLIEFVSYTDSVCVCVCVSPDRRVGDCLQTPAVNSRTATEFLSATEIEIHTHQTWTPFHYFKPFSILPINNCSSSTVFN